MQSDRDIHLDGLRGLAALVVVVYHGIVAFDYALETGLARYSVFAWDVSLSGAPFLIPMAGDLSVCVFFALSGYVLSHSFAKTRLGAVALLVKRYVRFTPAILSAGLISYALLAGGLMKNHDLAIVSKSAWLAGHMLQPPSLVQALQEGLYGALVLGSSAYNGSLWTMRIELWGSAILIAVFSLTALRTSRPEIRTRDRIFLLCMLGLLGCGSYLGLFAFGALMQLTQLHRKLSPKGAAILLGIGIFWGTIPYSTLPWDIVRPFVERTLPIVNGTPFAHSSVSFFNSLGAVLLLMGANAFLPFRRMLSAPPFGFLGQISFPLYLIHVPLLNSFVSATALVMHSYGFPYPLTMALSIVFLVAISIAAATALLFLSERPSIVLSNKIGPITDSFVRKILDQGRRYLRICATYFEHRIQHRGERTIAAFLLAPLAPCIVAALLQRHFSWIFVVAPFAYLFSLTGIPAYFYFRRRGWRERWRILMVSSALGILAAFLGGFSRLDATGIVNGSEALAFGGYGAVAGVAFWFLAYARNYPAHRTAPAHAGATQASMLPASDVRR
jgi:peptidoglycan/LPS O-acetylase OafA/YrhL